ncbi:FAD/NAD(P)-binding protein [Guptibacillus hwajinpoensis]|uniref:Thioredoxin reductase n=1 Tax=Guptibacillus hwajinpoensis TaxID=208199 RepID=A0ABU0JVJ0_9BACL|nr:FAD/NAD(P)-binding protein [Alkalihalobacillus hemicentroti]MDQ0481112.1 thioredoxin reductase [Alkalihalobacillus hemicentroti]
MYEWIIIGGGIHGCTIALSLLKSGKVNKEDILIIDPHSSPLERWKERTERIQMPFLRSPSVHHIDVTPFSLEKYAKKINYDNPFYGYYDRPSLNLFNQHAATVSKEASLQDIWCQSKVKEMGKPGLFWEIETEEQHIYFAKNSVIAIGNNELHYPAWANELNNGYHIFDSELNMDNIKPPLLIVGGGITAAHTAISLSHRFPGEVTLMSRHPFRVHDFDSDPGWLGPKYLDAYSKIKNYDVRRKRIYQARHRGSIPSELYSRLHRLNKNGKLSIVQSEIQTVSSESNVLISKESTVFRPATVLFATGFEPALTNQRWLRHLITKQNLTCANCGYPIVEESLEWCPHLFVMGPLAELEIGPASRNIIGARKATERIMRNIH